LRIGIFGGAFDPPHNGHVKLAEAFYDGQDIDKLIIVPTGISPHKQNGEEITVKQRLALVREAFKRFDVSEYELGKKDVSYTVNTLKYFKDIYKNDELIFLCGSDMLLSFGSWYMPDEILKLCTLCCACRVYDDNEKVLAMMEILNERFNTKIELMYFEPIEIASTQIRRMIKKGEDVSGYLAEGVYKMIVNDKLYFLGEYNGL